jgi:alpha-glucoside transport system substrate-binding protein
MAAAPAACRTPPEVGNHALLHRGQDGWTLTDWFENVYLLSEGTALYDKLTKHEIPWTHPSVKRALRLLSQLFGNPGFVAGGRSGALRTDYRESVRQVFHKSPKAAMVYEGDFVRSEQPNSTTSVSREFFEFPAIGHSERLPLVGGDVAVMLKDNDAARRLIQFLATPAAGKPWASAGGFVSPNRNFPLSAYADADNRRTAKALQRGEAMRFDLSDQQRPTFGATAGTGMWDIFRFFLKHPHAINEVARRLEAAATRS